MPQGQSGHLDSFLATPPDPDAPAPYVRGLTGPCELWTDQCRMEALSNGEFVYSRCTAPQQAVVAYACRQASTLLWRRSGRLSQLSGRCVHTVRPCVTSCGCSEIYRAHRSEHLGASWHLACSACGCRQPHQITLPRKPVTGIVEVVIDGFVLDPVKYAVTGYQNLIRLDGQAWPSSQDRGIRDASALGSSPTAPQIASRLGTWLVRYQVGTAVPNDAADIAAILALELYWSRVDTKKCRVPLNATSVSKGGVSITRGLGPEDTILEMIPEVKTWLRAVNPNDVSSRSIAVSPSKRRRREEIRTLGQ